jgi:hypothetical protein
MTCVSAKRGGGVYACLRYSFRYLRIAHIHGRPALEVFDQRAPHVVHSVKWEADDAPDDPPHWDLRKIKGTWWLLGGTLDSELKNFVSVKYRCPRVSTVVGGALAPFLFARYSFD